MDDHTVKLIQSMIDLARVMNQNIDDLRLRVGKLEKEVGDIHGQYDFIEQVTRKESSGK